MENIAKSLCNICMEADLDKEISGTVKPCMHIFCFNCIQKWVKLKDTCPNCLVNITKISKKFLNVTEEIEVYFKQKTSDHIEGRNLDCLDHYYFKSEVDSLEKRLNKITLNLSKNTKDFNIENKWKLIEVFKERIKSQKYIIQKLDHFEPEQFIKDVYETDSVFKKIELNKWNEINVEEYIECLLQRQFCDENNLIIDDYHHYEEDYYNDDDYEEQLYYGRKYSTQFEINNLKKVQQKPVDSKKKKNQKKNKEAKTKNI